MSRSTHLIAIAIAAALAAGFWFGRSRAIADHAAGASTNSNRTTPTATAARAGTMAPALGDAPAARDYTNETAISQATVGTNDPANVSRAALAPDPSTLPPAPPRPASPTENRLLGARGLRSADMQDVLMNPRFGQVVDALEREANSDSLEMTRLFRERLAANLKPDPRFQIERMFCGAHLCVVTATGPVGQDEEISNLMMAETKGPKWYAAMPYGLPPKGNATSTEYRVIFTIDPKFNSFEVNP